MTFHCPKQKQQLIPFALLALATVSGVITLVKVAEFFVTSAKAQSIVGKVVAEDGAEDNFLERNLAGSKEIADALKNGNLFVPPEPKRHPVSVVAGIMGDEAFINDQWHKVGDMIADAKIVAILPTQVRIEWEGRETTFAPMSATSAAVREPARKLNTEPADRQKEDKPVREKLNADSAKRDVLAGTAAEFSEKLMQKFLKQSQAFDQQKKHPDKQPDTVSKEQKQQYTKMLKQADAKRGNKKK